MSDRSRLKIRVTLAYEKLAQDRFPKITDPTPAEEKYADVTWSRMIMEADLSKAGRWTKGCRKCRAMKVGDHSQTNLAHSAECRARVAELLAEDVGFQTKDEECSRAQGRRSVSQSAGKRQ